MAEGEAVEHGRCRAAIFDLDGVIVIAAKYHYPVRKKLANELGFEFTKQDDKRLKGVSRMRSLEIVLEVGGVEMDEAEKVAASEKKNEWYVEYIRRIDGFEILPGARECLLRRGEMGVKIALGSGSKNTPTILNRLGTAGLFEAVVDGNRTSKAKPDPEVSLLGAQDPGVGAARCVVFEDAEAGLQATRAAGTYAIGVGESRVLESAHEAIDGWYAANVEGLF